MMDAKQKTNEAGTPDQSSDETDESGVSITLHESGVPGEPFVPGESGVPVASGESGVPVALHESGALNAPSTPGESGESGALNAPSTPGESGVPGEPFAPGESGVPGVPGEPFVPGESGVLGESGVSIALHEPGESGVPGVRFSLDGSALKLIAVITMLVDHVGAGLFPEIIWMRMVGRLAFPIFAFLLCEGFAHTRDIRRYAVRLGAFALISEVPFNLLHSYRLFDLNAQNVFFTLLIGLLTLYGIDRLAGRADNHVTDRTGSLGVDRVGGHMTDRTGSAVVDGMDGHVTDRTSSAVVDRTGSLGVDRVGGHMTDRTGSPVVDRTGSRGVDRTGGPGYLKPAQLLVFIAGSAAAQFLRTDYGAFGVAMIFVLYMFRDRRAVALGLLAAINVLMGMAYMADGVLPLQALAGAAVIPLYFYSGKRGASVKYLFYAFYPAHIAVIAAVKFYIFHIPLN